MKPIKPTKPIKPIRPIKPVKPVKPMKPKKKKISMKVTVDDWKRDSEDIKSHKRITLKIHGETHGKVRDAVYVNKPIRPQPNLLDYFDLIWSFPDFNRRVVAYINPMWSHNHSEEFKNSCDRWNHRYKIFEGRLVENRYEK